MDGQRFDDITRRLGRAASRRSLLKGITGGVAVIVVGRFRTPDAIARDLTICHATGDAESPFAPLSIDQTDFNRYARQGDFLRVDCCVDVDCASLEGACSSGICQNGYCTQLPKPAGTDCGGGDACTGSGVCDGALSCVSGVPITCPPASDACHISSCEPGLGCVETVNEGASCTPDASHEGTCDSEGVCQPILVCTSGPLCNADTDCGTGFSCINHGCFQQCPQLASTCASDCPHCFCTFSSNIIPASLVCVDTGTSIGLCSALSDCPPGALCSVLTNGAPPFRNLCLQPCQHLG
jgi:hypothetical protein